MVSDMIPREGNLFSYLVFPNKCLNPKCRSYQIEGGPLDVEGGVVYQEIQCIVCGSHWTDVYNLVDAEQISIYNDHLTEKQSYVVTLKMVSDTLNDSDDRIVFKGWKRGQKATFEVQARSEEEALDEFHNHNAIGCLDDFEISAKLKHEAPEGSCEEII